MNVSPPKYMNPMQLHDELAAAGVTVNVVLRSIEVPQGATASAQPIEEVIPDQQLSPADQATLEQVVNAHVGMRDKTDAEYATEFQDPNTTAARKQQIRDQMNGLEPREQVPMP
jgi:hypothetical protein